MKSCLVALLFFFSQVCFTDTGCECEATYPEVHLNPLTSDFQEITWTTCSNNECNGFLANNRSCLVSINGNIQKTNAKASMIINCNNEACVTSFYLKHELDDDSPLVPMNVCQNPKGCLIPDDPAVNGCIVSTFYVYRYGGVDLHFDFSVWNISWSFCAKGGYGEALITSPKDNITCIMTATLEDLYCPYNSCFYNKGPDYTCFWLNKEAQPPEPPLDGFCLPFKLVKDGSCGSPYFVCKNSIWLGCQKSEGYGNCTNPRLNNEICTIKNYNSQKGKILCKSCSVSWNLAEHDRFLTDPSCVQAVNDGSCAIPEQFKCNGVLWDICVEHNGTATCTHDKTGCDIYISSRCLVPDVASCGEINCDDGCYASWNQPDKPAIYEFPQGCMSNPDPSPDSSSNNNLIIPLSVTGGVIAVGTLSTVFGLVACLVYNHHKRQGYQTVQ